MYFNAQADAGLTRGTLAAGLGLLFWLAVGTAMVKWYDRRRFYRLDPDILDHVNASVQAYKTQHVAATPASSHRSQPTSGEATVQHPPEGDQEQAPRS
jgi:hypothetical protein